MMGNLISRTKSPATELERVALSIDELKRRLQTIAASNSNTLYYYYMSVLVVLSIAMAHTWLRFDDPTKTYVACALTFGAIVIVLAGRYIINGFYSWRTNRTTQKIETAMSQKTTLLDLVKETLKFKEAKEILDRYEGKEAPTTPPDDTPKPRKMSTPPIPLRKLQKEAEAKAAEAKKAETPIAQKSRPDTAMNSMNMTPYHMRHPSAAPVRPFLRQATAFDRILDYFMSDGPNCRNALICSICHTHNGMAVPAEYPYISFRCFDCGHFNQAKTAGPRFPLTRPQLVPKVVPANGRVAPVPPPIQQGQMENHNPSTDLTPSASQNGSDSETERADEQPKAVEQN